MLVLDMFDHEVNSAEGLLANHAHIFLTFDHLAALVNAVLVLHLDEQLVFLRVRWFLGDTLLKEFLSLGDVILLELPCRAVESRRVKDYTGDRGGQAQMLRGAFTGKRPFIFAFNSAEEAVTVDLAQVED